MITERFYRAVRPFLARIGLLGLALRVLPPAARARIAANIGLSGYLSPLPPRHPHTGPVAADGVNFIADLRADIGFGESSRAILSALKTAGLNVNIQEIETPLISRTARVDTPQPAGPFQITLAHLNPPELHIGLQTYPDSFRDSYAIGYWLWETPQVPAEWLARASVLDELWTPSRHAQEILARVTSIPVTHVPIPILVNPAPLNRHDFDLPEDRFIFFFSFNPASSVARKNPFGLIEAYKHAFAQTQQAPLLLIKLQHPQKHPAIAAKLREALDEIGGILLEKHYDRAQMLALMALSDCIVSLHRAEGFGLIMAEAMALGKPVIATAYSGNMDFMTADNSFPVRFALREISMDDHTLQPAMARVYTPGQHWAEPDTLHAAELMKYVVEHPQEAQVRAASAKRDMAAGWSVDAVAERVRQRLAQIVESRGNHAE